MSKPFFSVVVATYNRAHVLRRALDSALAQEGAPNFEILVTDDGSTDETTELLKTYEGRVVVLRQSNAGPAIARNLAIERARGDYVCFLDSDDYWFPWTLAVYRDVIERHRHPAFVVAAMLETDESRSENPEAGQEISTLQSDCYFEHLGPFFMIGCPVMVVKHRVLEEAGCFPARRMNCEDSDLCIRLGTAPGFVRIFTPPTVAYVRHEESLSLSGLDHIVTGVQHIIAEEDGGRYPGGEQWAKQRAMLVSTHARSASVGLLKAGRIRDGLRLYRAGFRHHWCARRWKFLIAFPLMALTRSMGSGKNTCSQS